MLERVRVASRCTADWEEMLGDERVRFCPQCSLNVYDLSAMTRGEAEELIARREGRLCARLYRRADGTVLTRDCPVGLRAVVHRVSRMAGAALSAIMSVSFAAAQQPQDAPQQKTQPVVQITPAPSSAAQTSANRSSSINDTGIAFTVVDPSGAVIPDAKVRLLNLGTKQEVKSKTDENGQLGLPAVAAGEYKVTIEYPGFATYKKRLIVKQGKPLKKEVVLKMEAFLMGVIVEVPPVSVVSPAPGHVDLTPRLRSNR
jgi:hypothetical protein